ncbi:DUF1656 domain-containing protein [Rhizobium tubonense]|uniref:DUF1656 domain-containing protein n=1 Tax=Rhizobium tubonense TaxID=484088 RepID=A0A2W4CUR1_9HYPH|nr:DUF1656 domain-containing protein [Rhizobium tubonense]PZM16089.1 hypothetical protein CPY51_05270 [Rhizobium tubonense]
MSPELNLYGVFVPTLGAIAFFSFFLNVVVRRLLARIGFYRLVWHRPLFDTAMYFCLFGALTLSINRIPL